MKIEALGHVVLKVRDQARAEAFYGGVLGFPVVARLPEAGMSFFSLGNHHDFAVIAVGADAPAADRRAVGLLHVAFRIGDSLDQLREARAHLEAAGIEAVPRDHGVTQSLYFHDPDGNEIELYVDTSEAWRAEPQLVARNDPLTL